MGQLSQSHYSLEQQHVLEILRTFRTVMLGTFDEQDGKTILRTRPMTIAHVGPDCTLYFVTALDSPKVDDAVDEPRGQIFAQSQARYLSLEGSYHVSMDRALVRQVWSKAMDVWFDGPADPRVCVLIFKPTHAELWDSSGAKGLRYLFQAAKALITGEKPRIDDPEQHASIPIAH